MNLGTAQPHIASYVLLRRGNKIAAVLRSGTNWMNGFYGLPAGKVEKNESFLQGAIREAKEEVGVTIKPEQLKAVLTMHRYDKESNVIDWVDVFFEATEWEGEPYNAEPDMHSELAWLDLDTLPDNVIPAVKFSLEQIKAGNSYAEYGWGS